MPNASAQSLVEGAKRLLVVPGASVLDVRIELVLLIHVFAHQSDLVSLGIGVRNAQRDHCARHVVLEIDPFADLPATDPEEQSARDGGGLDPALFAFVWA